MGIFQASNKNKLGVRESHCQTIITISISLNKYINILLYTTVHGNYILNWKSSIKTIENKNT